MDFLVTLFLIVLALILLMRLLAPYLLKLFVKRMSKRFEQQANGAHQQNTRKQRKEGEITIEQNEAQDKVIDNNIGEYVDFEEE